MFRRITVFMAAFLLILSLTGCMFIPSWKKIDVRYDVSEISSVEVYDLVTSYDGRFMGSYENINDMEEDLDPVDTLESERFSDFVSDLEGLTFTNHMVLVLAPMDPYYAYQGYTVKITYENGDYDILSSTCQLYQMEDDDDENNWSCDEEQWNRFIKRYFTVDKLIKPTPAPTE